MKNVKVVDVKRYIDGRLGEQIAAKGLEIRELKLAVIKNGDKAIVSDNEAIHDLSALDEAFTIDLFERSVPDADGVTRIALVPSARVTIKVAELVQLTESGSDCVEEATLTAFVKRFGSRIESNYKGLLRSIKELGLAPEDYPRLAKEA